MKDLSSQQELAHLRARVAALEQLLEVHEHTVLEQADRLEGSLADLRREAGERASSEKALRHQTRLLQSVLDGMSDGVVVVDEQGRFLLFNPAAEQILGIGAIDATPAEWPGHYGLFLPDRVTPYPADRLPLVRAMRGEAVNAAEVFVHHARAPQ